MADIKLYYFAFKGRAECIRLLLSLAGQKFDDIRFQREDWPKYKAEAPYGQAPFIEINGEKIGQSLAILQHIAREYNLYGDSNKCALVIDQVIHLIQELVPLGGQIIHEKDPERKAELVKEMKEEKSPRVFGYIEEILKQSGTGFVAGSKLTLGDLAVFDLCNSALKDILSPLENYPLISALIDKVSQNERIKAYLDSRPDTVM